MKNSLLSLILISSVMIFSTASVSAASTFEYRTFSSCQEMESTFSTLLSGSLSRYAYRTDMMKAMPLAAESVTSSPAPMAGAALDSSARVSHTETNVQVRGIDEPDTMKTDGRYLYVYNEWEKTISILETKTLTRKKLIRIPTNYSGVGFLIQGNRLVLTATKMTSYNAKWYGWYNGQTKSIIAVYDISQPERARMIRTVQVDGALVESRLADDGILTAVVSDSYQMPIMYARWGAIQKQYTAETLLPQIRDTVSSATGYQTRSQKVASCTTLKALIPDAQTIAAHPFTPTLTSIIRFDTTVSAPIQSEVILSEAAGVHVSRDSIYLTSHSSISGISPCPRNARCAMPMIWNPGKSSTLIHRFAFSWVSTRYVYSTSVSGSPLSQYSMDEDPSGYFRLVSSESDREQGARVSILSQTGALVGSLTRLAPGENFQSSRFIGDRLYLVTFEQIDPLFVISLANREKPTVLWELKIPGYSTYLHPYDSSRLIGIGYDTQTNQWGGVQNAGLKIDLYNVADVKSPRQEQSLVLGGVGSSSEVLSNPRAFVFDPVKNLLLLPALIMESAGDPQDTYRARSAYQGLIWVSITPQGITEKFRTSHITLSGSLDTEWRKGCTQYTGSGAKTCRKLLDGSEYCSGGDQYVPPYCYAGSTVDTYFASRIWEYSRDFITRSALVGDQLYTVSESAIQSRPLSQISTLSTQYRFAPPRQVRPDIARPMIAEPMMVR